MKISLSGLDKDTASAVTDFCAQFDIEIAENGLNLNLRQANGIEVECDGKTLSIAFEKKNMLFRAIMRAKVIKKECFSFKESCALEHLGIMVDCSRNAVLNVSTVKRYIRYLAATGYNELQLYTEDTYEVDNEPYFGYLRGKYSKSELKEIDSYASMFGIEVVPCIQTLAHFTAIRRWPGYAPIIDEHDILLVGEERTYELIENIFASCAECFSSRRINIGMDEAHLLGLGKYLQKHGYRNRFDIMCEHLEKVASIAKKYGFNPMMWSDMFFRLVSKGDYYNADAQFPDEVLKRVNKDVGLIYWDYTSEDAGHYTKMIKAHKKFPNKISFAGASWSWMGFAPHMRVSVIRTKAAMDAVLQENLDHFLLTIWGMYEVSGLSALPAMYYAAEQAYGKDVNDSASMEENFEEMFGITLEDFYKLDLPNILDGKLVNTKCVTPAKYLLYNDAFMGIYDCTLSGTEAETYKRHAEILAKLKNNKNWGYLFELESVLCEALSVKSDLGQRTRAFYAAGDKLGLKRLAEKDYNLAIEKTEMFYEAIKNWFIYENKPQGFEVHATRLGGLKQRLKYCRDVIIEYSEGKLEKIEELEEKLIDFATGKDEFSKQHIQYNFWLFNTTAGNIS